MELFDAEPCTEEEEEEEPPWNPSWGEGDDTEARLGTPNMIITGEIYHKELT